MPIINNSFSQLSSIFENILKHRPDEHARLLTEKYSKLIKMDPFIQEHPAFLHMQKKSGISSELVEIHSSYLHAQKLAGLNVLQEFSKISERNSFLATILSYECYSQKIMGENLIDIIRKIDISDTSDPLTKPSSLINYIGRFIKITLLENTQASIEAVKSTTFYTTALSLIRDLQENPENFEQLIHNINEGTSNPLFEKVIKAIFTKALLYDLQLRITPYLQSISETDQNKASLVNVYISFLVSSLPNTSDIATEVDGHFVLNQILYPAAALLLNENDSDIPALVKELYFIAIGHDNPSENSHSAPVFNPSCSEGAAERILLYMHMRHQSLNNVVDHYATYRSIFYSFIMDEVSKTPSRFINSLLLDTFVNKKTITCYYPNPELTISYEEVKALLISYIDHHPSSLIAFTEIFKDQLKPILESIKALGTERIENTKIRIIAQNVHMLLSKNSAILLSEHTEASCQSIFIDFLKSYDLITQKEKEVLFKKEITSFDSHPRKTIIEKNKDFYLYELFKNAILQKKIINNDLFDFIFSCFFIDELGFSKNSIFEFFYGDNQWIDSLIYKINHSVESTENILIHDYQASYDDFKTSQESLHQSVIFNWSPEQGLLRLLQRKELSYSNVIKIFTELKKLPVDRLIFNLIDYLSDDLASQCYLRLNQIEESLIQSRFLDNPTTLAYIVRAQNSGMSNFNKNLLSTIHTINSFNKDYAHLTGHGLTLIEHFIKNPQLSSFFEATVSNIFFDHNIFIGSLPLIDYIMKELSIKNTASYIKALNQIVAHTSFNDTLVIERNPLFVKNLYKILESSYYDKQLRNEMCCFIMKIFELSKIDNILNGNIPIIFDLLEPAFCNHESFFHFALDLIADHRCNVHMTLTGQPIKASSSLFKIHPLEFQPNLSLLNHGLVKIDNHENLGRFILTILNHDQFRGFSNKWQQLDPSIMHHETINLESLVHKFLSRSDLIEINFNIAFNLFKHPAIKSARNSEDQSIEHALLNHKSFDLRFCQKFYDDGHFDIHTKDINNDNLLHFVIKKMYSSKIQSSQLTLNRLMNGLKFLLENNPSLLFSQNDFQETPMYLMIKHLKNEAILSSFFEQIYEIVEKNPLLSGNVSQTLITASINDELSPIEHLIISKYFELSNYLFDKIDKNDISPRNKRKLVDLIISGMTNSLSSSKKMICSKLILSLGYNEEGEEISLTRTQVPSFSQIERNDFSDHGQCIHKAESRKIESSDHHRTKTPERIRHPASVGVSPNSAFTTFPEKNAAATSSRTEKSSDKRKYPDMLSIAFHQSLLFSDHSETHLDLDQNDARHPRKSPMLEPAVSSPKNLKNPVIPFPSF